MGPRTQRRAACTAVLAAALAGGCASPPPPPLVPPLQHVGTRTCTNALHVALASDGRYWAPGAVAATLTRPVHTWREERVPGTLGFEWETPLQRRGEEPPRPRAGEASVDVFWQGPKTGERLKHTERVRIDCDGTDTLVVSLPRQIQVEISTDPPDVSVFLLAGYRQPRYLGTTPLTLPILEDPTRIGRWHLQLQKSGMVTDTLLIEQPRDGQIYRVVLHPLPHRRPGKP